MADLILSFYGTDNVGVPVDLELPQVPARSEILRPAVAVEELGRVEVDQCALIAWHVAYPLIQGETYN